MKLAANVLYVLVGIVFPILIGSLHTFVHFADLTTSRVQQALSEPIFIMGAEQPLWPTWGVMSFMMGTSFIIIGLLNIVLVRQRGWQRFLAIGGILSMIAYLLCVIYVGNTFHALPQFYGGIFGLTLVLLCLGITLSGVKKIALHAS